jgi:hypothetical protein
MVGKHLLAHELTHTIQQRADAQLQAHRREGDSPTTSQSRK